MKESIKRLLKSSQSSRADLIRQVFDCAHPLSVERWRYQLGLGVTNPWARYADDPVGFSEQVLGSHLTEDQKEVMESVRDHKITVVMSANAVGKTYVGADIAIWFTRCLEGAKTITAAAPPLENLQRLLWGEIDARRINHPEVFDSQRFKSYHFSFGANWFCDGVAIPAQGAASVREAKFSGKHAPYLLFMFDEADAIPAEVYRGTESCMSGGFVRLVCFFNPRESAGPVYHLMESGANVVKLDAFSHPNVLTGDDVIPGAVSRGITLERIEKWSRPIEQGENVIPDSGEFFRPPEFLRGLSHNGGEPLDPDQWRKITDPKLSYMVLARFPGASTFSLFPMTVIRQAQERWLSRVDVHGDLPPAGIRPVVGFDVADAGVDHNCVCSRYGHWVDRFDLWANMEAYDASVAAGDAAIERLARSMYVDSIGVGATAPSIVRERLQLKIEELRLLSEASEEAGDEEMTKGITESIEGLMDLTVSGVKFNEAVAEVQDAPKFANLWSRLLWELSQWLKGPHAMLPPSKRLERALVNIKFWYDSKQRFACTAKSSGLSPGSHRKKGLKDVIGFSPDELDALLLTFCDDIIDQEVLLGWG